MANIQNPVFSGAGVDGAAHVGAVKQLQKELGGSLKNLPRVGGTSAGAIMALMIALNCTAEEIEVLYLQINFKKIPDGHNIINELENIYEQDSICDGTELRQVITHLLSKKHGHAKLTFADLAKQGYKDLHVTTTIVGERFGQGTTDTQIFNAETTPDTEVLTAVLASASIPGLFPPIFMQEINPGQFVEVKKPGPHGPNILMHCDGGYTLNFPVRIFDKKKYLSSYRGEADGDAYCFNPETLGFLLCPPQEAKHKTKMQPITRHHPFTYALALAQGAIFGAQDNAFRNSRDPERTVLISNDNIAADNFNITDAQKTALIKAGETATKTFFHPTTPEEKLSPAEAFAQKRLRIPSPIGSKRLTQPLLAETLQSDNVEKQQCCLIL